MKPNRTALTILALALVALPAAALIPSGVPTRTTVSVQDGVLYTYTDPNTASTARLAAHDGALWCEWHAVPPPGEIWAGLYFFTYCAVQPVGGGRLDCHSDSALGTGGADGSCQIASFLPSTNLQWWISSSVTELVVTDSKYTEDRTVQVARWQVSGSLDATAGLQGAIDLAGTLIASATLDVGLGFSSSFEVSKATYSSVTTTHDIRTRYATVLGLNGGFVNTVPAIETLTLDGRTWGCDALNVIEYLRGPRDLGGYTNSLKARALKGEIETDLADTRLKSIDNKGAFQLGKQNLNGYVAYFDNAGSGSGAIGTFTPFVNAAVAALDGDGMKTFSSSIAFTADYETPDVPLLLNMATPKTGATYRVILAPIDTGGIVASRDVPALSRISVLLTVPELSDAEGDLADLVAARLFDAAPGTMVFNDFDCPPTIGIPANRHPQAWTTAASVQGFSGATNAGAALPVDVYMDLNPY